MEALGQEGLHEEVRDVQMEASPYLHAAAFPYRRVGAFPYPHVGAFLVVPGEAFQEDRGPSSHAGAAFLEAFQAAILQEDRVPSTHAAVPFLEAFPRELE